MAAKRLHVFVSGYVQGIGFRYHTRQLAHGFNLHGFVRNLPDGRVEIVAEGDERMLKKFLEEIEHGYGFAEAVKADARWLAATNEFDRFEVRF